MVLDDLSVFLEEAGIAQVGLTLFKGSLPLEPPPEGALAALLALIEVPGLPPLESHEGIAGTIEQPMVQVVVRGLPEDYLSAWDCADAAYLALDGVTNVTINTVPYLWIWAQQPPFFLRQDALGRHVIVFNIRCARVLV